jgi:hypothetical protein
MASNPVSILRSKELGVVPPPLPPSRHLEDYTSGDGEDDDMGWQQHHKPRRSDYEYRDYHDQEPSDSYRSRSRSARMDIDDAEQYSKRRPSNEEDNHRRRDLHDSDMRHERQQVDEGYASLSGSGQATASR